MAIKKIYADQKGNDLSVVCHLLGYSGLFMVFLNILAPLLFWFFKKEDFPAVSHHGREAVNFQISWSLWVIAIALISAVTFFIERSYFKYALSLSVSLLSVLALAWFILIIIAAIVLIMIIVSSCSCSTLVTMI